MTSLQVMPQAADRQDSDACACDIQRLGELPDRWIGLDSAAIARDLLENLLDLLELDFVALQFSDDDDIFFRASAACDEPMGEDRLRTLIKTRDSSTCNVLTLNHTRSRVAHLPMGMSANFGVILASADRADFPNRSELSMLKLAALLAGSACREANAFRDRRRPATPHSKPAADLGLDETEGRLDRIISAIPAIVWSMTPDGRMDSCSEAFQTFTGRSADELTAQDFTLILHPEEAPRLIAKWQDAMAAGQPCEVEARLRQANGEYRWFLLRQNPLVDSKGHIVYWFCAGADIEERKQAEAMLAEAQAAMLASEQNFDLMINALPVLVWSARPDGTADFINQTWRDYVGANAEEILEWRFLNLYHPDDVPAMLKVWEWDRANSDRHAVKGRIKRADGQYRWFYFAGRKLTDANGVVRWFGCNVDIEDLQRSEDALRASEAALRESEQALGQMLDAIPVMAWSTDAEGHADKFNRQCIDFTGMSLENLLGTGFLTQFHPDDLGRMLSEWQALLISRVSGEIEGRARRADGEYRWLLTRCNPVFNDEGDVIRWYGVNLDIEDRKRAEEALKSSEAAVRDSERQLSLTIGTIPAMVWSTKPDGMLDSWNQTFLDFAGVDFSEVKGDGFYRLFHPDDQEKLRSSWDRVRHSKRPEEVEGRMRSRDGDYRWFTFRQSPLLDNAGNVLKWYGVVIDIEDRKQAEQALHAQEATLRDNERRLQQIVSSIPGLTWSSDAHGATTFWSQQYLDYAGAKMEDILGFGFVDFIHPDDRVATLDAWEKVLASGEPGEAELRLRRSDGVYRWYLIRASPFIDDEGKLTQWFGVNIDIENRKQAEESLRQSQNELAHVTRLTTMGELAVSIAHEVNQPLMAVVTNAGACLRWLSDSTTDIAMARQAAERIIRDGHRAGDIITSLRNLARKSSPRLDEVILDQIIGVVLKLAHGELRQKEVIIDAQLGERSIAIIGDSTQLQQVLLNLVMNAVDAMVATNAETRCLIVRLEASNGMAQVSIIDNGTGLASDGPDRVFEAFFTTKAEGLGMGLSICRSIIEAHGGQIWASNNPDHGSTFSFTLPLAQ